MKKCYETLKRKSEQNKIIKRKGKFYIIKSKTNE